ncbi:MAG: hypothetical protein JJ891_03635 [Rhizobiaceae bacterium]|jgi:Ca2+-binding EF-hand superfamily protein|nr:hypothetical protein [Rhizobiaceae bacterium]
MKKLLLAVTVLGFASGSALAQASFESIDADQNGGVTLEEANAAGLPWTPEQFKSADSDQNGMLDAEEFAAATQ